MRAGNYSVKAAIIENGKLVKGTLTLFNDEYVFGNVRKSVNWENVICEQGTTSVKVFLRSVDKQYVVFNHASDRSMQFILESSQASFVLNKVREFGNEIRDERVAKANKVKREEDERQRQAKEEKDRHVSEKSARIKKAIEASKGKQEQKVELEPIAVKAAAAFLDNPYRILGVSCATTNEEANSALDKLKKLARLKALEVYRSPFDLNGLDRPTRDLSVAQNALALLKDKNHKLFWFVESDACMAWRDGKYRIELVKDGEELGTYDLFLANYMYAIFCDSNFNVSEIWKRIFNYYVFICKQSDCKLFRSRFSEKELQNMNNADLLNTFRSNIFKPLLMLCDRDDLDAVIRLHKCIRDCDNRLLEELSRNVVGKLVSWFTDKETAMLSFLRDTNEDDYISEERGKEIRKHGEEYCSIVEPVFEIVLCYFRGDAVRYDMIKESYRSTTYQFMYELNKCSDKSNAIVFANKCYVYCKEDDKQRIKNTFGEANIKVVDWNTPHTGWDVKGDDFYYGRGCAVDYTHALYWYHKVADEGNMYSKNSIGICYQEGHGVPQSDEQAVSWFRQASDAGNPQGAYNLAECYFEGKGVRKDIDMALKYWGEATKLGHPSAESRKSEIFSKVQFQRRNHRSRNHICHDLGFQMTTGLSVYVEVTVNQAANVYLVNQKGYQNYLNGNEFSHQGGYITELPARLRIPSSNHWYVIVDNGDEPIARVTSSVKVKNS